MLLGIGLPGLLREHLLVHQAAPAAPIAAGEVEQQRQAGFGGQGLGGLEIHRPFAGHGARDGGRIGRGRRRGGSFRRRFRRGGHFGRRRGGAFPQEEGGGRNHERDDDGPNDDLSDFHAHLPEKRMNNAEN